MLTGDFPGNYTATGTYRGKPDFFNDDGSVNLYFELATSGRRRSLSLKDGEEDRLLPGEGENRPSGKRRKIAPPTRAIFQSSATLGYPARSLSVTPQGYSRLPRKVTLGYPANRE